MDVLILTVFVSLILAAGALLLLIKGVKEGDFEHGDRLSLLPLEEDLVPESGDQPAPPGTPTAAPVREATSKRVQGRIS
jgi:hypothetical protein